MVAAQLLLLFTATICQYVWKCYLTIWHLFVETHVHWGLARVGHWLLLLLCLCLWGVVRVVLIQLGSTLLMLFIAITAFNRRVTVHPCPLRVMIMSSTFGWSELASVLLYYCTLISSLVSPTLRQCCSAGNFSIDISIDIAHHRRPRIPRKRLKVHTCTEQGWRYCVGWAMARLGIIGSAALAMKLTLYVGSKYWKQFKAGKLAYSECDLSHCHLQANYICHNLKAIISWLYCL